MPQYVQNPTHHNHDPLSTFIVARIRFGPEGVSSACELAPSSLGAADAVFRFIAVFFRATAVVGEGEASSSTVLSGMTFYI